MSNSSKQTLLNQCTWHSWQRIRQFLLAHSLLLRFSHAVLFCVCTLFILALLSPPSFAVSKQSSLAIEQVQSEFYPSGEKMSRIRDVVILNSGALKAVDILISINSRIVMSDVQQQMLLNGIPLTFVYDIRLNEKVFFGGNNYAKEIRYLLFYHGLSKQFVVRDLETKKQHSYPTLSLALLSISTPTDIEFKVKDERGFQLDQYEGSAKLWLDIEALPTPLRIPAYLSSHWWLNSSWFKWELTI